MGKFLELKWQANLLAAVSDSCRLGLPNRNNACFRMMNRNFLPVLPFSKDQRKHVPFWWTWSSWSIKFPLSCQAYKVTKDETKNKTTASDILNMCAVYRTGTWKNLLWSSFSCLALDSLLYKAGAWTSAVDESAKAKLGPRVIMGLTYGALESGQNYRP